jgi:hypothetical protein
VVAGAVFPCGHAIGLRREGRTVTVWFYELPIGHFVYGEYTSVQPMYVLDLNLSACQL